MSYNMKMTYNTRSTATMVTDTDNNGDKIIYAGEHVPDTYSQNTSLCGTVVKNISGAICLMMFTIFYYANKGFMYVWKIGGIYIIWCSLHYGAAQLYAYYCTPSTIWGFIIAPFMVATPQCTGLRWCIMRGADTIISMWLVIGAWFMQKLGGYSLS